MAATHHQPRANQKTDLIPRSPPSGGSLLPLPAAPAGLLDRSHERWAAYWGSDAARSIDPASDLPGLERWIVAYDEWTRATDALRKVRIMPGASGQAVLSPMQAYQRSWADELMRLEEAYGMTPAARLGLPTRATTAPRKRRRGHPTKLSAQVRERILGYIRVGNRPATAARACGIDERTFYRWMERGEVDPEPDVVDPEYALYADFADAVRTAVAECEATAVSLLYERLPRSTAGLLEFLKRRFGATWGDRLAVDVDGQVTHTIASGGLGFEPDVDFAQRVVVILQAVGKLPEEVDPASAARLLIAPQQVPAAGSADGGPAPGH